MHCDVSIAKFCFGKIFVSLSALNKFSSICQRRSVILARKRPGLEAKFLPWQL